MDAIDALGELAKGAPHKYISRKKVGNRYVYTYPEDAQKRSGPKQPVPKPERKKATDDFAHVPQRHWTTVAELGLPADTQKAHQKNGEYTPERKAMHERVYSLFLDHVPRVPDDRKPVAIVMMGGTAAGKGTVVKHVMGDAHDFVNVNPDDCKEKIPEYHQAVNVGERDGVPVSAKDAALMAHEESSDMAEEIRKRAIAQRKNLILDGTGKNAEKYRGKIEELKAAGYHVRLLMPHVDMAEAQLRAKQRAQRSGRYVPDEFVEMAHHLIPGNFEKISSAAHEAVLFDNRKPPPRPVWVISNEENKSSIRDEGFVSDFQRVGRERHVVARQRGWMKSWAERTLLKAGEEDKKPPSLPLDDMLERFKINRGEAEDVGTGIEDDEDVEKLREILKREKTMNKSDAIDALGELVKGFPPTEKGNNVNDDPSSRNKPPGAKKMAPQGAKQGPPGNSGQGPGGPEMKPPKPAKPGEGKPGDVAQAKDPAEGSVQYPTKVKNPETGEFEFVYLSDEEREQQAPEARFVVSDETAEGAHWEQPQDGENYEAFKQWKSARKQGLSGEQIPKDLVEGAVKHAEDHHFDGGPHKAAYDDYLAHHAGSSMQPPPSHQAAKNGAGSHPAMQGQGQQQSPAKPGAGAAKPGAKPPQGKKDLIGKLSELLVLDSEIEGGVPAGSSRTGTEHATSGRDMQADEDEYERLYGEMRRSGDAIDALAPLAKAGARGGKYKSRKRVGNRWVYDYGDDKKKPSRETWTNSEGERVSASKESARAYSKLYRYIDGDTQLRPSPEVHDAALEYAIADKDPSAVHFIAEGGTTAGKRKAEKIIANGWPKKKPMTGKMTTDEDSLAAMGANDRNGPTGEVLMASLRPEPDAVRPLQLRKSGVYRFRDEEIVLNGTVERASHANIFSRYARDEVVKANFDPHCLLHGVDVHKVQLGHGATASRCSCPK